MDAEKLVFRGSDNCEGDCAAPVYQMTEYYREGTFDNCRSKWTELFDCLSLKTKPADQLQVCILFHRFLIIFTQSSALLCIRLVFGLAL